MLDNTPMPSKPPIRTAINRGNVPNQTRVVLTVIKIVLVIVGLAWAANFGYGQYVRAVLLPSSKEYVDAAIPAIASNWSEDELIKRLSSEEKSSITHGQLNQVFDMNRRLGILQQYRGAHGGVNVNLSFTKGATVTADYVADVKFENGDASIRMVLVRRHSTWEILGFHVNPPLP